MTRYATVVEVPSDSSDATYRVYVAEDGPIFCSCPGFRLRPGQVDKRKPCKHMRRLGASRTLGPAMGLDGRGGQRTGATRSIQVGGLCSCASGFTHHNEATYPSSRRPIGTAPPTRRSGPTSTDGRRGSSGATDRPATA